MFNYLDTLTGSHRIDSMMDIALEQAILNGTSFTFIDWQSRNHRGLSV